jgi:uncharacterized integral membrane protein
MRVLVWLLRLIVFLALFALALNNQHAATLHSFFGLEWHTRMIYIVLAAFVAGCAIGVLAMVPRWWRGRSASASAPAAPAAAPSAPHTAPETASAPLGAEATLPREAIGQ